MIGQASRIGGANPEDVNALLVYLEIQDRIVVNQNRLSRSGA